MVNRKVLLAAGALLAMAATTVSAQPLEAKQYGDFDRYVLALSWQTGFCQSMHERQ
ncbi:ribonuclease I, partial [Cronobacter malonaticus]|nr:ribonuclease I [Cronobacter malonaticus]